MYESVRMYYEKNTENHKDEDGCCMADISNNGTWMKRGYTAKIGIGVIMEVCTCFILDWEVLSKYCVVCERKERALEKKEIDQETFKAFQ